MTGSAPGSEQAPRPTTSRQTTSRDGRPPMFDAALLQGKRILVTGGGTGLGKEMAVGCAAHGAHVYICGRRKDVLDQAVREIRERSGGGADAVVANVRDHDSI